MLALHSLTCFQPDLNTYFHLSLLLHSLLRPDTSHTLKLFFGLFSGWILSGLTFSPGVSVIHCFVSNKVAAVSPLKLHMVTSAILCWPSNHWDYPREERRDLDSTSQWEESEHLQTSFKASTRGLAEPNKRRRGRHGCPRRWLHCASMRRRPDRRAWSRRAQWRNWPMPRSCGVYWCTLQPASARRHAVRTLCVINIFIMQHQDRGLWWTLEVCLLVN